MRAGLLARCGKRSLHSAAPLLGGCLPPQIGVSDSSGRDKGGEFAGLTGGGEIGHLEGTWVYQAQV